MSPGWSKVWLTGVPVAEWLLSEKCHMRVPVPPLQLPHPLPESWTWVCWHTAVGAVMDRDGVCSGKMKIRTVSVSAELQ